MKKISNIIFSFILLCGIMLTSNNVSYAAESTNNTFDIQYKTHIQNIGWENWDKDGKTSGTEGKSLRLEGIYINLNDKKYKDLKLKYQVHVQNVGWQDWKSNGQMAGTEGKSLRLEAIKIILENTDEYSVMYKVHVQNVGWQDWKYDGEIAGTEGKSLRLEAIQIKIVPKVKKGNLKIETPVSNNTYYTPKQIDVLGWKTANVSDTKIEAYIDNSKIYSQKISYVERKDINQSNLSCGTINQNLKPGYKFSIDATKLSAGNHTIKIVLMTKDNKELKNISTTFKIDRSPHIQYQTHVQNIGWQDKKMDGNTAGTEGRSLRVEAVKISLINVDSKAKILYQTHVQNVGWQDWKSDGNISGTEGLSLRVEAIRIKLENLDKYTVEYQVHIQNVGWSDWYIDGETAGTVGESKRVEAIRIRLVDKKKRNYSGIDVSSFNGDINWSKVKNAGVDFAMIRVGYRGYGKAGNFREDNKYKTNITSAINAKIPVGVYFVTQAINESEAIEEANWVLDRVKGYSLKYPIAIDVEDAGKEDENDVARTDGLDKNTRTNLVKAFCQKIKSAGYTPIIYTNVTWATNYLDMSKLSEYDTWIAHYKNDISSGPSYKGKYTMWQHTSSATIDGISGRVDKNICYKKY